MGQVTSTYTLINGEAQRRIIFTGTLSDDRTTSGVQVMAEGQGGGAWLFELKKGDTMSIHENTGTFILRGSLTWSAPYNAIMYTGDLVLINWAQVHMANCPVLVL